ncbi:hypothetical protein [Nonomuraea salmonea]|uniref:hypothetical protein n=1 Tax=Nonomuraea salmonea TaxID=46181 RepID=UPI0031E76E9F
MLVHGVWAGDGLAFWAETTDPPATPPSRTTPRTHPPRRHGARSRRLPPSSGLLP